MTGLTARDLIACLLDGPLDAEVFFADGDEVAGEPESGLTAWRVAIEHVETVEFNAHGDKTVGYIRLVGRSSPGTPETENGR